jgi:hypothetical protein
MTIQCFERGYFETSLIAVVVREFYHWQAFVPSLVILKDAGSKNLFQNLIYSFSLSICLRMICRASN